MKKLFTVCAFICFTLSLFIMCTASLFAQEKVITLRFSDLFPATHKVALLKAEWCKEIEKRTNGRVKFDFFPGSTLTSPAQTYDSVLQGIVDVGESFASYTSGIFPLTEVIDLPLGYKTAHQGTKTVNEFYKKFRPKEWDAVQVMFFHTAAPQNICTKKITVTKLEDMKGLKIRSTGTSAAIVQALGGAPVGMSMGEAYDAISRGVANGVVCPSEALQGWKLGEVVNFCTVYSSAHTNAAYVIMNKNKWNALPKDIQQIIEKVNEEYIDKQGKLWDELDKGGADFFAQKGGKVSKLTAQEDDKWKKQLEPILSEYVKKMKSKNLPGDEALKFCQDYLRSN